jgi:sugar diacid utilization regulator
MSHELHLQLVGAVLGGEGLARVAELLSAALHAPVAILVPRIAAAAAFPVGTELSALRRYADERVRGLTAPRPADLVAEAPVLAGEEVIGVVALLRGERPPAEEARELLQLAAVASLTEVAVEQARREVEETLRASLLDELRAGGDELDGRAIARRAARLGCDLSDGAVALCAELTGEDGDGAQVVATIAAEHPGALAQALDRRVHAILPALPRGPAGRSGTVTGREGTPADAGTRTGEPETVAERTLAAARRLALQLEPLAVAGLSSFCPEAGGLPRALREAELVLDVLRRTPGALSEDVGRGTYRLLFRMLASHPDELRAFRDDTVGPLVRYDERHRSELVGTLEAYLAQDCNVNATAAAIGAHRHTVAHRLERVKELSGLDPLRSEDRERLGLGLKAQRLLLPAPPP